MNGHRTEPCIFTVSAIDGNSVETRHRYDWLRVDDEGNISSVKLSTSLFNEEKDSKTYIYHLSHSQCETLGIDKGSAIKYDGHSMEVVDEATVKKIINF